MLILFAACSPNVLRVFSGLFSRFLGRLLGHLGLLLPSRGQVGILLIHVLLEPLYPAAELAS
ncbi:MAG: hypothetical protein K8T91_06450 [Planctomycetes bacterium]|nr:hypothetical protein [Planctomycetota bacterium]